MSLYKESKANQNIAKHFTPASTLEKKLKVFFYVTYGHSLLGSSWSGFPPRVSHFPEATWTWSVTAFSFVRAADRSLSEIWFRYLYFFLREDHLFLYRCRRTSLFFLTQLKFQGRYPLDLIYIYIYIDLIYIHTYIYICIYVCVCVCVCLCAC